MTVRQRQTDRQREYPPATDVTFFVWRERAGWRPPKYRGKIFGGSRWEWHSLRWFSVFFSLAGCRPRLFLCQRLWENQKFNWKVKFVSLTAHTSALSEICSWKDGCMKSLNRAQPLFLHRSLHEFKFNQPMKYCDSLLLWQMFPISGLFSACLFYFCLWVVFLV